MNVPPVYATQMLHAQIILGRLNASVLQGLAVTDGRVQVSTRGDPNKVRVQSIAQTLLM